MPKLPEGFGSRKCLNSLIVFLFLCVRLTGALRPSTVLHMNTPAAVASETRVYPSKAAADRAYRAHRDGLIAALGWAPEGRGPDAYLASSVELWRWLNEKRASEGLDGLPEVSFTNSFNMERVKVLTVYKFDATGVMISKSEG